MIPKATLMRSKPSGYIAETDCRNGGGTGAPLPIGSPEAAAVIERYRLANRPRKSAKAEPSEATKRIQRIKTLEPEAIRLHQAGETNKAISQQLGISESVISRIVRGAKA